MSYPVAVTVETRLENGNRLTGALRPILAIPHMILVGPGSWLHRADSAGLLGAAAYVLAIVNWSAILISGEPIKGISRARCQAMLTYLIPRTRRRLR